MRLCETNKNNIDDRLEALKNLHPCLSSTHEREKDGQLPFLDMIVHNNDGRLMSIW